MLVLFSQRLRVVASYGWIFFVLSWAFLFFKEAERWNIHLQKENRKKFVQWRFVELKGITSSLHNLFFQVHLLLFESSLRKYWNVAEIFSNFCHWHSYIHSFSYSSATRFLILDCKNHIDPIDNMYFSIFSMKEFPPFSEITANTCCLQIMETALNNVLGKSVIQDHILGWTSTPWPNTISVWF